MAAEFVGGAAADGMAGCYVEPAAPYPAQLDPASIPSPILDMDPGPIEYDDNTLAVLHFIQRTPAEIPEVARRLGLSRRVVRKCLNQLIHDRKLKRISTQQPPSL